MSTIESNTQESEVIPTFEAMPLSDEVRQALVDMSYERPTPVQWAVWQPTAEGKDVVVQARTGTGKTAAFGLPILDRLVTRSKKVPQALVLCPTRELALQVSRELDQLGRHLGISIFPIYGGASMERQVEAIDRGVQVVVGTPGRVLDHLRRGTLSPSAINVLVLDESDEMLSMGFERELTAIIEHLPAKRQTMLFSATLPPDIERMARTRLREPEFLTLSSDQVGALEVDHYVYWVVQDKIGALLQVLEIEDPESAIIFCNTREATEVTAQRLQREGFESDWLNGDLPQSDREKVMRRTREGRLRFLVATDVAARGIDISHLTHVINYDFPQAAESYVHRTGRTGRAGRTGTALSLVTPQEVGGLYILRLTYKIRPVERQLPSATEQRTRLETDIVQGLAELFAPRALDQEYRALARRLLTHDDAERILAGLLHDHLAVQPDLPELSQSRRRARNPEPVSEQPAERGQGGRGRKRRSRDDDRAAPKADVQAELPERPKTREPDAEPAVTVTKASATKASNAKAPAAKASSPKAPAAKASSPKAPTAKASSPKARSSKAVSATSAAASSKSAVAEPAARDEIARAEADSKQPSEPKPRRRRRARTATQTSADGSDAAAESPPVADDAEEEPAVRIEDAPPVRPRASASAPATKVATPTPPEAATMELHVDAGRRDGANVRILKSLLVDGGVALEAVHRMRVRERYSFVEVDRTASDACLEALTGAKIGERTLTASVSERSNKD